MKKLNKKIKTAIKVAISVGFLTWIIWTTDWKEVLFYLKGINVWFLVSYVAVLFLGFWISSYKWQLLARHKKIDLSHFTFFKLYFVGTFINNFMPSFIAGDAYKAYAIGKKDEYAQAASSVMMDRITGLIGATLLAILFSLLNIKHVLSNKALVIVNIVLLFSFAIDLSMPHIRKILFLRKLVLRFAPQKVADFLRELYSYGRDHHILAKSIFYSVIFSLIGVALLNYLLFLALGISINPLDYLSVVFLIAIVSSIPISINNIGIKEWAYITFFGAFGINPAAILTVAIISRTIQMVVSFCALPFYARNKK